MSTSAYDNAIEEMTSYYVLIGVFAALCCCGILFSLLIIFFNCRYQNHRQIKMSSPRINIIGMVGAILLFLAGPLHQKAFDPSNQPKSLDHTQTHRPDVSCGFYESFLWCVFMGFSLFYGSLVVKSYRVYQIFKVAGAKKIIIPDWHLIVVLLVVIILDAIILTSWHFTSPITFSPRSQFPNGHFLAWVAAQLCHKFILMSVGLFVSWKNRMVNFSFLVDSPSLIMITFITLVAVTIARCLLPMFSDTLTYCAIQQSILYLTTMSLVISAHTIKIWKFLFNKDSFNSNSLGLATQPAQKDYDHVCHSNFGSIDNSTYYRVFQINQELNKELSVLKDQNRSLCDKLQKQLKHEVLSSSIPESGRPNYQRMVSKSLNSEDRSNVDSGVEIPDYLHPDNSDHNSTSNFSPNLPLAPASIVNHLQASQLCSCRLDNYCAFKINMSDIKSPIVAKNIEDYKLEECISLNSCNESIPQSPEIDLAQSIVQTYRLNEDEDVRYVSQCLTLSLQKRVSLGNRTNSIKCRQRASTDGSYYTSPASEYFKTANPNQPRNDSNSQKCQS